MAKLDGGIPFRGGIGGETAYKMKGVKGIILRSKGGASKEKIKTDSCFERTRENNSEWGGCSKAGKQIRKAMAELKLLADYNISAELNKIAKMIQLLDPEGNRGERSILLSKHCHSLEGFNLNRNVIFDGVVRRPLSSSISREALSAILELPEMNPGLDFYIPGRLPLFSITAVLGVVPDMVHTPFGYRPAKPETRFTTVSESTEWASTAISFPAQSLQLSLPKDLGLDDSSSLMLSVGISFGMPITNSIVDIIKNTGCAKILKLA